MSIKYIIIISLLLIPILTIGSVCSEDIDDNSTLDEVTLYNNPNVDDVSESIDDDTLQDDCENDEILSLSADAKSDDSEKLNARDNNEILGRSLENYIDYYDSVTNQSPILYISYKLIGNVNFGKISISIDGEEVYNDTIKRNQWIKTNDLTKFPSYGIHQVTVSYSGDNYYNEAFSKTYDVDFQYKFDSYFRYNSNNVYGSIYLPDNANGNISIRINNKYYENIKWENNELVKLSAEGVFLGNNNVTVYYHGDSVYPASQRNVTLYVNPLIHASSSYIIDDEEAYFNIIIPVNENGTVKFYKRFGSYYNYSYEFLFESEIVNNHTKIKMPIFENNTVYFVEFFGKIYYTTSFYVNYFKSSDQVQLTATTNITEGETAQLRLVNNHSTRYMRINIDIDGKNVLYGYLIGNNTSSNFINMSIPNLSAGTHKIVIRSLVDLTSSLPYLKEFNITVNEKSADLIVENTDLENVVKMNSIVSTPVVSNIISLSLNSVKIKKSVKKIVLQANLKVNNKLSKNTYVTFKFNGKSYKVKTNSKGIAKLAINKAVIKKLKLNKNVKYQVSYGGKTVQKTAIVKK